MLGSGEGGGQDRFRIIDPAFDDANLSMGQAGRIPLAQWVASLAFLKARAGAAAVRAAGGPGGDGHCIVIGADTLVEQADHHGRAGVLSKPTDAADAERMIKLMRCRSHGVLTGVALLHPLTGRRDVFTDRATVSVGDLSDGQIAQHIAAGRWRGKAGGYNLSEQLRHGWPLTVEGDPGCVVGLPTRTLAARLVAFAGGLMPREAA